MTKRRRPAASRRLAEQRFWGTHQPPAAPPAPADAANGVRGNGVRGNGVKGNGSGGTNGTGGAGGPGAPNGATSPEQRIRPTSDPGVLVRSLGAPPLALDPAVVERHLTAVYEEAVRAATALAAASGLLADDEEGA